MTEERVMVGDFYKGQVVQFTEPTRAMRKHFGLRVYDGMKPDVYGASKVTPPEDETLGMVLDHIAHGVNSPFPVAYYKILMGERLLWIADEHLKVPVNEA